MSTLIYWMQDDGAIGHVQLDAVDGSTHEDALTITEHPVEFGANVTDHAREEPARLTVEGVVSAVPNPRIDTDASEQTVEIDVPGRTSPGTRTIKLDPPKPPLEISPSGLIQAGVTALVNAITGGPDLNATFEAETQPQSTAIRARLYQQNEPRDRVRDVYETLLRVQAERRLRTVNTAHREYTDMMIERVSMTRSTDSGSSGRFSLELKRIRVAASETVQAPQPTEARGKGWVSKGSQNGKPDPNADKKLEKGKSIFKAMGAKWPSF